MKSSFSLSRGAKTLIALTILTAFLIVALFGFLFMEHHQSDVMAHASSSCVASAAQGSDCPETATPLDFILFHFNAFKTFSTAILSVLVFILAVFVLIFFRFRERLLFFNLATVFSPTPLQHLDSLSFPYRAKVYRWLILHKKRDPYRS